MEWQVIDGHLEVSMGVAHSKAEVYDAENNQLRIQLRGGGEVVKFIFPQGSNSASRLEYSTITFERVK